MPRKRSYLEQGDACATAHAMELVGDRWNYPILRELMLAPKRFGELSPAVRGITPAVLTERLRTMESAGLVRRTTTTAPGRVPVYDLTPWARELEPIFRTLGRWAQASPGYDSTGAQLTPDATAQAMLTMASHAATAPATIALHLVDDRVPGDPGYNYRVTLGQQGMAVDRGQPERPALTVSGTTVDLLEVLFNGADPRTTGLSVEGDRQALAAWVAQFAASPAESSVG